jgi:protein O-GlcNAc transferase
VDADATLLFLPWQPQAAFFAWLDRADVFLDTPGFSGFNTVMQALERGTPVVAWEGRFMRGRFASAVLRQAELDAWVAGDAAGYVERVERLCADEALRRQVRRAVAAAAPALYRDRAGVDELARFLQERLAG